MDEQQRQDSWTIFAVAVVLFAAIHREVFGHTTIATLGSYNFTTAEPALAALLVAVFGAMLRRRGSWAFDKLMALVLAGLIGLGVLRGLPINAGEAIISLRSTGILAASMALAAWANPSEATAKIIVKLMAIAAIMLSGLVVLRLLFGPTLLYQAAYATELEINDGGRGVSGAGATLIAIMGVLAFSAVLRSMRARRPCLPHFLLFVALIAALLLSRQTTATLAGAAGLAAVTFWERGPVFLLRRVIILVTLAMVGSILLLADDPVSLMQSLLPDWVTGDVWRRANNLGTRQLVWSGIMADFANWSWLDRGIGLPAGVKPSIVVMRWGGVYWQVSAHSMYYGTLIYAGLSGLLAYILFGASLIFRLLRNTRLRGGVDTALSGAATMGLATVIAIFGVSYEIRNELALVLAFAALVGGRMHAGATFQTSIPDRPKPVRS